jgi:hypothetical protein
MVKYAAMPRLFIRNLYRELIRYNYLTVIKVYGSINIV